jgi:FixJ family two-component response regulator
MKIAEDLIVAIVDDDLGVRNALQDTLESHGYESRAYVSAEDFHRSDVGCIVSDVKMPGMSGVELQTEVKKRGGRKPIIFVSSYDDMRGRERVLNAGASAFLQKPFTVSELIDSVKTALKAA